MLQQRCARLRRGGVDWYNNGRQPGDSGTWGGGMGGGGGAGDVGYGRQAGNGGTPGGGTGGSGAWRKVSSILFT